MIEKERAKVDKVTLNQWRKELRAKHKDCYRQAARTLELAWQCGDLLCSAKDLLKHGEWLPWLETAGVPERTATRYMRVRSVCPQIGQLADFDSVAALLEARKPRPEVQLIPPPSEQRELGIEPSDPDIPESLTQRVLPESTQAVDVEFVQIVDPPRAAALEATAVRVDRRPAYAQTLLKACRTFDAECDPLKAAIRVLRDVAGSMDTDK